MHDVAILNPSCYFREQQIMLNVIEVGFEIQVNDARLLFDNRLGHSSYGCMRSPIRAISIRPGLEVSFEDRLQDKLQRALDHAITDSRYRKNADFAPILRYFLLPYSHRPIRVGNYFRPNLLQETFHSTMLDGFTR